MTKSIDLFDPVTVGNCPAGVHLHGAEPGAEDLPMPPKRAMIAYSPAGYAAAVWENFEPTADGLVRTAPVYSVFDGTSWSSPKLVAGPEFAGWEPQIGFIDAQNAAISWVIPNAGATRSAARLAGVHPHGLCDLAGDVIEFGCDVIEGAATVVKVICLGFCGFGVTTASVPEPISESSDVVVLGGGPGWNVRPVLRDPPGRRRCPGPLVARAGTHPG